MISPVGHYEPIAREGYAFIIPPLLIAFGFWWYSYAWISFVFLLISVGIALFFRNPERATLEDPATVLSPADGHVVQIESNVQSRNIPDRSFKRISIFMSVFNVHVNRWPISGSVRKITHVPGGFVDARFPAASLTNEHNSIVLDTTEGPIEVVQIAGMIARRIVCWVRECDTVRPGSCIPQYAAEKKKSKGTNVSLDRPCEKGNPPSPTKRPICHRSTSGRRTLVWQTPSVPCLLLAIGA